MPRTGPYWLDANVLIEAKTGPFRFDIAPAFWSALEQHVRSGAIRVPKMVYDEIVGDEPKDKLAQWLKLRRTSGLCVNPDKDVQQAFEVVANHVIASYELPFAAHFLSGADPWVIAHAMSSTGVVVTFETADLGTKRVKIPNVCKSLDVPRMNLYDMMQALKIRFA